MMKRQYTQHQAGGTLKNNININTVDGARQSIISDHKDKIIESDEPEPIPKIPEEEEDESHRNKLDKNLQTTENSKKFKDIKSHVISENQTPTSSKALLNTTKTASFLKLLPPPPFTDIQDISNHFTKIEKPPSLAAKIESLSILENPRTHLHATLSLWDINTKERMSEEFSFTNKNLSQQVTQAIFPLRVYKASMFFIVRIESQFLPLNMQQATESFRCKPEKPDNNKKGSKNENVKNFEKHQSLLKMMHERGCGGLRMPLCWGAIPLSALIACQKAESNVISNPNSKENPQLDQISTDSDVSAEFNNFNSQISPKHLSASIGTITPKASNLSRTNSLRSSFRSMAISRTSLTTASSNSLDTFVDGLRKSISFKVHAFYKYESASKVSNYEVLKLCGEIQRNSQLNIPKKLANRSIQAILEITFSLIDSRQLENFSSSSSQNNILSTPTNISNSPNEPSKLHVSPIVAEKLHPCNL